MGRISMPQGKGSQMHNRREYEKYGFEMPNNIDPTRTHLNVTLVDKDIRKAYKEIFGSSVERYNARQSREDRKIEDYYEKIAKSKNGENLFYEDVLQWGKMEDFENNPELREKAKEALLLYAESFESRNPNLKVIGAYIHMDEASPHLHLDYIPVAHGYSRGMDTRNSLDKAMKEMGYHPEKESKLNNATKLWKENERAFFGEICRRKGLEVEAEREARGSLSVEEYKEAKERMLAPIREEKEKAIETLKFLTDTSHKLLDPNRKEDVGLRRNTGEIKTYTPLPELKRRHDHLTDEIEQKRQEASALDKELRNKETIIRQRNRILKEQDAQHKEYDQTLSKQKKEIDDLFDQIERMRYDWADAEKSADKAEKKRQESSKKVTALSEKIEELQKQEHSLNVQIDRKRSKLADMRDLASEVEQKRQAVAELDRKIEGRQEELDQIVTRITGLKVQEQSLSPKIAHMRSELAESKSLAGEVNKKRQAVAELDRQIEDRQEELLSMADIDEHEMKSILNDAVTKNIISRIIRIVCKLLSEWGIIRTDWHMLAVRLTKPVHADLGESMDGFLQEVKEHRLKSIKSTAQKKRKTR